MSIPLKWFYSQERIQQLQLVSLDGFGIGDLRAYPVVYRGIYLSRTYKHRICCHFGNI